MVVTKYFAKNKHSDSTDFSINVWTWPQKISQITSMHALVNKWSHQTKRKQLQKQLPLAMHTMITG